MFTHFSGVLHFCILQVSVFVSMPTELNCVRIKGLDDQHEVLISKTFFFFVNMKNKT